jgi:hypothetical protein
MPRRQIRAESKNSQKTFTAPNQKKMTPRRFKCLSMEMPNATILNVVSQI